MVALAPVPFPVPEPRPSWRNDIVAESPAQRRLLDQVERVAPSTLPILLLGETGSGKDVIARCLHAASGRSGPLVAVNCAALPESLADTELFGHVRGAFTGADRSRDGLIVQAHGGMLLLDEVGDLGPAVQAKLLRVVEDGAVRRVGSNAVVPVDVRIVAATNRDLAAAIAAGRFRSDLYHRLAGVTLTVPPLRERPEDIEPLARWFLAEAAAERRAPAPRLSDAAIARLAARPWPGNVRELRQAVRRGVLLGGAVLTPADFEEPDGPSRACEPGDLSWLDGRRWYEIERDVLAWALARYGNARRAAIALGLPRSTLADRMKRRGVGITRSTTADTTC